MKFVNRNKFIHNDNRVINCQYNRYVMTVVEAIWFASEMRGTIGYHKASFGQLILTLLCPWLNDLVYTLKDTKYSDWYVSELFSVILAIALTLCGLGPVCAVIMAYYNIKENKHLAFNTKMDPNIKEMYKKVQWLEISD